MMLKKPRYFFAFADKLHFEQASSQVGADPSAFSRKIRELERDLGVRLFDRSNQGTRGVTPAGVALEPLARIIVAKFDQALHAVREATPERIGQFLIDRQRVIKRTDLDLQSVHQTLTVKRGRPETVNADHSSLDLSTT
jgi:DNA-binding transcriptional LysR family regulator